MKAWVIDQICDLKTESHPLKLIELPKPVPREGELLIKVSACGVCHTEIEEIEGRTPPPVYPVVPGHQVVGIVEQTLGNNTNIRQGDRVGIAWIYSACGTCGYCLSGRENLCSGFKATGRDVNGGYAEYMVIPETFAYPLPDLFTDAEAAPLLCLLDCIIDTTPVWETVLRALERLKPGGRLVINAIRKESIDQEYLFNLDYVRHLWMEKEIKSVANITSHDVKAFLRMAAEMPFKPEVEIYPFKNANQAIMDIKQRKIKGAKVLVF